VYTLHKKDNNNIFYFRAGYRIDPLTGFHLFYCSATLFEKNSVSAIGTPDVDVYLNFLLASGTFVCTCHTRNPNLSFNLFKGPVNRALGNLHGRCLGLVCPSCKLIPAFTTFPDAGAPALN
jgi:hypothetical protein